MPFEGTSNLRSTSGATIRIDFTATFGGTPGSAAWQIYATNFRCRVELPQGPSGYAPGSVRWFVDNTIIDMIMGQTPLGSYTYSQPAPFNTDVLIRSGDGSQPGQDQDYKQYHRFQVDNSSWLIDPMNGTNRFQTDFFFATPYATMNYRSDLRDFR